MTIGPSGIRTKAIRHEYPYTDGLTAETTKQTGHKEQLEPQDKSNVPERDKAGF